jgi:precorrin-6B methylase 2
VRSPIAPLLALALVPASASCTGRDRARDAAAQASFDRERRPDVLVRALGLTPGQRVADVGAGTGLVTVHLARAVSPGGHVVATDIDAAALERLEARMRTAGCEGAVEARLVRPSTPGLERGAFDAILLARVDQMLENRVAWLRAAGPALRHGGRLVIANRSYLRDPAVAAAEAAGFRRVAELDDVPGEYVAVFEPASGPTAGAGSDPSREVQP